MTAVAFLFGACSSEKPRSVPRKVYIVLSSYCQTHMGSLLGPYVVPAWPEAFSMDVAVVDVGSGGGSLGSVRVVARTACTSLEIPPDVDPVALWGEGAEAIASLVAELPPLPVDGGYALVGGIYIDDADCSAGGTPPFFCLLSTGFGDRAETTGWVPAQGFDAGAPPEGAMPLYMMCPSDRAPCLTTADCEEDVGVCNSFESAPCQRDSSCRSGRCEDEGYCDDDAGVCMKPVDGGPVACQTMPCPASAQCNDDVCIGLDGVECLPGTCQDDDGLTLEGDGYSQPITYVDCRSLHTQGFSSE